jgi:hypothetical protein
MLVYGGKRDKPETDNLKAVGIKKSYLLKYFMVCSQGNERGLEPVQGFHALICFPAFAAFPATSAQKQ